MLTPVSFKKGRPFAPRLSAPCVPGRQSERFWSDGEVDLVREHYEAHGATFCLARLPGRTITGVYQQAKKMGLSRIRQQAKPIRIGKTLDETIQERWPTLKGRGAVQALADELGVRRHAVTTRAVALGLTLPHRKEPRWSPEEEALLRQAPVNNPNAAAKFFAAHGFRRTPSSIAIRCKRIGISRRRTDVFSAGAAARVLGVDNKTMGCWCAEGLVHATRRGTQRLPQQGGDTWTITPADLRHFVLDELDRIDIRKVDKHAFVDLLVGKLEQVPT